MGINIKGYKTRERRERNFYLATHSTHFIYSYMASDIWLRTILIVRKETRCRHIGYSYWLTARVLLYAPSHRQDSTYHGLCYTSHGALAGTRNSSMGPPHEGSIRRPIAPWANALPLSYVPLRYKTKLLWSNYEVLVIGVVLVLVVVVLIAKVVVVADIAIMIVIIVMRMMMMMMMMMMMIMKVQYLSDTFKDITKPIKN